MNICSGKGLFLELGKVNVGINGKISVFERGVFSRFPKRGESLDLFIQKKNLKS